MKEKYYSEFLLEKPGKILVVERPSKTMTPALFLSDYGSQILKFKNQNIKNNAKVGVQMAAKTETEVVLPNTSGGRGTNHSISTPNVAALVPRPSSSHTRATTWGSF